MNFNISNLASIIFSVNKNVATNKTANKSEFQAPPTNNSQSETLTPQQFIGLANQITISAKNIMNNMQQNIFLRDMLNLPKEWTNLLNEFAFSANNAQLANLLKNLQKQKMLIHSRIAA